MQKELAHIDLECEPLLPCGTSKPSGYDPELAVNGGVFDEKFAVGQVTIRLPLDRRPLPILGLVVSFIPWLLPAILALDYTFVRRASSGFLFVVICSASLCNEYLLKSFFKQPRPEYTANRDLDGTVLPGMPSGHVLTTQIILTYYILKTFFQASLTDTACTILLLTASMPLVPWARWYNGDHSLEQVCVTAACATVVGVLAFVAYHFLVIEDGHHDASGAEVALSSLRVVDWHAIPLRGTDHGRILSRA